MTFVFSPERNWISPKCRVVDQREFTMPSPPPVPMRWEIRQVLPGDPEADALLSEGWEPFSATFVVSQGSGYSVPWLRRQVSVPSA